MSAWIYRRPAARGIIELGIVRGSEVGLPTHFHAEDQFTFVLAGRRRFVFGERPVAISSGQGTLIPAGTPHSSLSEPDGVVCINVYASQHPSPALLQENNGFVARHGANARGKYR
jgi:mannose-6-phosphate isomerase-like protein (cupin superfamily)